MSSSIDIKKKKNNPQSNIFRKENVSKNEKVREMG